MVDMSKFTGGLSMLTWNATIILQVLNGCFAAAGLAMTIWSAVHVMNLDNYYNHVPCVFSASCLVFQTIQWQLMFSPFHRTFKNVGHIVSNCIYWFVLTTSGALASAAYVMVSKRDCAALQALIFLGGLTSIYAMIKTRAGSKAAKPAPPPKDTPSDDMEMQPLGTSEGDMAAEEEALQRLQEAHLSETSALPPYNHEAVHSSEASTMVQNSEPTPAPSAEPWWMACLTKCQQVLKGLHFLSALLFCYGAVMLIIHHHSKNPGPTAFLTPDQEFVSKLANRFLAGVRTIGDALLG